MLERFDSWSWFEEDEDDVIPTGIIFGEQLIQPFEIQGTNILEVLRVRTH
jgi:hypothetical protein